MGAGGARRKCRVEIQFETSIEHELVLVNLDDVHLVVALEVDFAEVVFIEK